MSDWTLCILASSQCVLDTGQAHNRHHSWYFLGVHPEEPSWGSRHECVSGTYPHALPLTHKKRFEKVMLLSLYNLCQFYPFTLKVYYMFSILPSCTYNTTAVSSTSHTLHIVTCPLQECRKLFTHKLCTAWWKWRRLFYTQTTTHWKLYCKDVCM